MEIQLRIQDLVKETYFDFKLTDALEKIQENHAEHFPKFPKAETFRKWCHEIHHVKRRKRRRAKARYARQRMRQLGLMIQVDGSPHRWFGSQPSCLIAAIDDATSEIPYAEFFHSEDTISFSKDVVTQSTCNKSCLVYQAS